MIHKVDMGDPEFQNKLEFELLAVDGTSVYRNDRERPYDGQPWTENGIRGKTIVKGLSMRDIRDCLVMAFLQSCNQPELSKKVHDGTWRWNDVYLITDEGMDFGAVGQNLTCNIEKMMDIFPNLEGCPSVKEIMEELETDDQSV